MEALTHHVERWIFQRDGRDVVRGFRRGGQSYHRSERMAVEEDGLLKLLPQETDDVTHVIDHSVFSPAPGGVAMTP